MLLQCLFPGMGFRLSANMATPSLILDTGMGYIRQVMPTHLRLKADTCDSDRHSAS